MIECIDTSNVCYGHESTRGKDFPSDESDSSEIQEDKLSGIQKEPLDLNDVVSDLG